MVGEKIARKLLSSFPYTPKGQIKLTLALFLGSAVFMDVAGRIENSGKSDGRLRSEAQKRTDFLEAEQRLRQKREDEKHREWMQKQINDINERRV